METKPTTHIPQRFGLSKTLPHPPVESDLAKTRAAYVVAEMAAPMPGSLDRPIKILRLKCVMERTGLKRSAVYYLMDSSDPLRYDPTFPKSIKISKNAIGWIEEEITGWLHSRVAISRAKGSIQ